jgi:hypothetical protein
MGSPYLLDEMECSSTSPSPVAGEVTIYGATASKKFLPLRRRLLFNRLMRAKEQRILIAKRFSS